VNTVEFMDGTVTPAGWNMCPANCVLRCDLEINPLAVSDIIVYHLIYG